VSAVDDILAALRHSGARVTATRRATVETLLEKSDHHTSAEEIIAAVRARHPEVAESTIYRTLSSLEELGLLSHVHLDHGPATFHLSSKPHRHLLCRSCREIIEVPADLFASLGAQIEGRYGFVVSDEHFALTGECRSCRQGRNG
jgi:Fur family ferric uptake transcriptional regulator